MKITRAALWAVVIAIALLRTVTAAGTACESLLKFAAENTTVTVAEQVPAGGFRPPATGAGAQNAVRFSELPAFCRVAATLKPTADSDIKIEVWMPTSGWNGKFEAVGNGGWAGTIGYPAMAQALARVQARITALEAQRQRIQEFQAACAGASAPPAASKLAQLLARDPRR